MVSKMSTSYKRLSFTNEQEELLIDYIKCHPALWDANNEEYGNGELRKHYWVTIAGELNKSVLECRRKWRFIRDYYIHKRRRLNDSTPQRDGKYFSLHFLDKVSVRRLASTQKSNVTTGLKQESKNGPYSSSTVRIQKLEPDFEDSELEYSMTPDVTFEKVSMERMDRSQNYILDNVDHDQNTNDEPSADVVSNDEFNYDESPLMNDFADLQKLEENEEEHLVEADIEDEPEQPKNTDISKHEKAIDLFFESMAAAVKTFPPHFVAEAKLKVFTAVNELEMRLHSSGVKK